MPPWLQWLAGGEIIGTLFAPAWKTCGGLHLVPTAANGQPAFAVYEFSNADKRWNARSIHVLTMENEMISRMTLFLEPRLFANFGQPQFLPLEAVIELLKPLRINKPVETYRFRCIFEAFPATKSTPFKTRQTRFAFASYAPNSWPALRAPLHLVRIRPLDQLLARCLPDRHPFPNFSMKFKTIVRTAEDLGEDRSLGLPSSHLDARS